MFARVASSVQLPTVAKLLKSSNQTPILTG